MESKPLYIVFSFLFCMLDFWIVVFCLFFFLFTDLPTHCYFLTLTLSYVLYFSTCISIKSFTSNYSHLCHLTVIKPMHFNSKSLGPWKESIVQLHTVTFMVVVLDCIAFRHSTGCQLRTDSLSLYRSKSQYLFTQMTMGDPRQGIFVP